VTRGALSARSFDHITRVTGTIADLVGTEHIACEHVAKALLYRG
jgi:predicted ATPase with chaperone activity